MLKKLDSYIRKHPYIFIFTVSFLMMAVITLPSILMNNGYFIFSGDYNTQELPFYQHLHKLVRSGNLTYDLDTGLGQDVLGFYSYYCLTKIFFWLTVPFPNSFIPFLMPVLMCLKFAFSSLFSCMYIRRFVKSQNAYLIGGILYAFSGFMVNSLYFPGFNDVFVFFPLLLISLEETVANNRKGFFALMIAFSAITNYYFFIGQAIFIIFYFYVRADIWNRFVDFIYRISKKKLMKKVSIRKRDFPLTFRSFFQLIFEGIIGILCSMFVLLPSYINIMVNQQMSDKLYGNDLVVQKEPALILEIIRSLFMLPDMPAESVLFNKSNLFWSSDAVALPVLGIIAVVAFFKIFRSHWTKTLIILSAVMVCVPGLNAIFQLMNPNPYYRWLYMPILILAMMSAKAIENLREENRINNIEEDHFGVFQEPARDGWKLGVKITFIALGIFGIIACLPTSEGETPNIVWGNFPNNKGYFWIGFLIVLALYITIVFLALKKNKTGRSFLTAVIVGAMVTTSSSFYFSYGFSENKDITAKIYNTDLEFTKEEGEFFRIDNVYSEKKSTQHDSINNTAIFWDMPSISLRSATMNSYNIEFNRYFENNSTNGAMQLDQSYYGLRGLLSVKYYYENKTEQWDVYENKNYIPMGFAFDYYITEEQADKFKEDNTEDRAFDIETGQEERLLTVNEKNKGFTALTNTLVSALILSDEQALKYSDIIAPYEGEITDDKEQYELAVIERQSMSCSSFIPHNKGFTAEINLDNPRLVFFSVPYSDGFSATVNGKPAVIEKVDIGMMAVKVSAGDSTIRFHYKTPGLGTGIILSSLGVIGLLICFIPTLKEIIKKKAKKEKE